MSDFIHWLSNDELKQAFTRLRELVVSGERIISVNDGGLSFTKEFVGEAPTIMIGVVAREIAFRKGAGTFPTDELDQIPPRLPPRAFPVPRAFF